MKRAATCSLGVLVTVNSLAHASLIGDEVTGEFRVDDNGLLIELGTAVVGDGVEFMLGARPVFDLHYDFDDESLWITYTITTPAAVAIIRPRTVTFSDLDWLDDLGNPLVEGEIVGFDPGSGSVLGVGPTGLALVRRRRL